MENQSQKAQQDLPSLRQWANTLLTLTSEMVENVQYSENDHFGFMALCFLSKQVEHMRSILILDESRDVGLIARSMLEGMCQLLWAAEDPGSRGLRWRAFAWVHDWRTMRAQIAANESVDVTRRATIEQALREHGDQFLKRKARKACEQGTPLPDDPYCDNWTGHSARQIFDSVKGEVLYLKLYKPFSEWHHWSPGGLGTAIARQRNQVVYSPASLMDSATALATGIQCLLQTAEIVDRHLGIGMSSRIVEVQDGYIAWHKAQCDSGTRSST